MTAHRRASLQLCGRATASNDDDGGKRELASPSSFDDGRDVSIDAEGIVTVVFDDVDVVMRDNDARSRIVTSDSYSGDPALAADDDNDDNDVDQVDAPSRNVQYHRPPPDDYILVRYGDVEGRYHVDPRILGTGQHGSVRRCIDRITDVAYAIKSIRKDDPNFVARDLMREIEMLRVAGGHGGIIRLFDVYEDDTHVHLVTDLCEGGELFGRVIARRGSSSPSRGDDDECVDVPCLTEGEAARILGQILDALSHMHGLGIAHRDVKPENVMFATTDDDSPVRLIDLGLSRGHDGASEGPMSRVVGTPYYIAPEVLRGKYDKSCDLWSVGVVAYVLLCGYPPFNGDTDRRTYESVLRGRCDFHAGDWKNIGVDAMDFVRKLLDIDPGRRMTARQALDHPWMTRNARRAI